MKAALLEGMHTIYLIMHTCMHYTMHTYMHSIMHTLLQMKTNEDCNCKIIFVFKV